MKIKDICKKVGVVYETGRRILTRYKDNKGILIKNLHANKTCEHRKKFAPW